MKVAYSFVGSPDQIVEAFAGQGDLNELLLKDIYRCHDVFSFAQT
jgi:hypothetical protein